MTVVCLLKIDCLRACHCRYLLFGAAVAMGEVAIWCMHYLANKSIIILDTQPGLQIIYSPGFTAGSSLLSFFVVASAFYLLSISGVVTLPSTIVAGIFMGGAICGMHYLGQVGISNFECTYNWRYVVGSAIVSVTASTIALGFFFYLKSNWTSTWFKRVGVALMLATGVSGMHWVATFGTEYRLIRMEKHTLSPAEVIDAVAVMVCFRQSFCRSLLIRSSRRLPRAYFSHSLSL